METWATAFLNPSTVVGVLAFVALLLYWWKKDASNPATTASHSVITASVEYTSEAFRIAQEAMVEASQANKRALAAEKATIKCAQTISDFADYSRVLLRALQDHKIAPPAAPEGLMAWVQDSDDENP